MSKRHSLLARFRWPAAGPVAALRAALENACELDLFRAVGGDEGYAYIAPASGPVHGALGEASLHAALRSLLSLSAAVRRALDGAIVTRLTLLADIRGASAGAAAPYRYVVETDVLADHEDDFNAWYEREHLPGLAAVEGTVRAMRYRNTGAGARYHACYDLSRREAVGSPAWLAVRATAWSSRVRPAFRNTKRTMFQRVAQAADDGNARAPR